MPDGDFADEQHARSRGIAIGAQQPDGMSAIKGHITPEFRAIVEPVLAKLGTPGMCNPDDPAPLIRGRAPAEAVDRDTRNQPQRNHDAIAAGLRSCRKPKR